MKLAEELYQAGFLSYPRTETDIFDPGMDLKVCVCLCGMGLRVCVCMCGMGLRVRVCAWASGCVCTCVAWASWCVCACVAWDSGGMLGGHGPEGGRVRRAWPRGRVWGA